MSEENASYYQPDWFLQSIVKLVNESDSEIGITLSVGGMIISGYLVGGPKYFDAFGTEFASVFKDPEIAASIYSAFSSHSEMYKTEDGDSQQVDTPTYIHLKNAKFFHNSGPALPTNRGIWWRGRLASIDGFTLGNLGPSA